MKKIYLDFETTTPEPISADILESTFLFVENNEIVDFFTNKIKLKKKWNEFNQLELETLAFNKINSECDYNRHQSLAIEWDEYISRVMKYYIEMFQDYDYNKDKPIKLPLSGWNNSSFDNIIFSRHFNEPLRKYFDYHTRDIMHRFQILVEIGMFKGLKLSKLHIDIFGTIKEELFHDSKLDCIAVKELDEWFEKHILGEIKQ